MGNDMIITKADLDRSYTVLGTVHGYAIEEAKGCSGKLALIKAFQSAESAMTESATAAGADAVVGLDFQQRDTQTVGCGSAGRAATEVYANGTAVKFD
jgi:uncharacterized protein YbjQ (UPF0145 family)